jgi:hypothetical protein
MFYCDKPADKGGETPICLSNLIYEQISKEFPDFIEEIGKKVKILLGRCCRKEQLNYSSKKEKRKLGFAPNFCYLPTKCYPFRA